MRSAANLPDDIEKLKQLILEQQATIDTAHAELADVRLVVEKLRFELARLHRQAYGRSSEALDARMPSWSSRWKISKQRRLQDHFHRYRSTGR